LANSTLTNDDAPYDSESDLSEVAIPMIDEPSPASSSNHQSEFGGQETDASDSSPENHNESEDADFDMEDSPALAATNASRDDRSTSIESRRPAKRKLGVEEDEHILANPELYGLRRSVCCPLVAGRHFASANSTSFIRVVQYNTEPSYVVPQTLLLRNTIPKIQMLIEARSSLMKTTMILARILCQRTE
jgi:hypothetical protein